MKPTMTTEELAELLDMCARQGKRALRIERELGSDPEAALRIARVTMAGALRRLDERISGEKPVRV